MNQFLIGLILVLGVGGYFLYQENITLKANNPEQLQIMSKMLRYANKIAQNQKK